MTAKTFESFCRKNRYHLYYAREISQKVHVTHNYWNGRNYIGPDENVGPWYCHIDSTILGHGLRHETEMKGGGNSNGPVPTGRGLTRAAAKRNLIEKIEGTTLFIYTVDGKRDVRSVPKGMK